MNAKPIHDQHGRRFFPDGPGDETGKEFFVSVLDAARTGYLLGPYATHAEALANVDRGRKLADAADPRSPWYRFGTCGAPVGTIKKTVFGK